VTDHSTVVPNPRISAGSTVGRTGPVSAQPLRRHAQRSTQNGFDRIDRLFVCPGTTRLTNRSHISAPASAATARNRGGRRRLQAMLGGGERSSLAMTQNNLFLQLESNPHQNTLPSRFEPRSQGDPWAATLPQDGLVHRKIDSLPDGDCQHGADSPKDHCRQALLAIGV